MPAGVWYFPKASLEQLTTLLERVARVLLYRRLARLVCTYKLYLGVAPPPPPPTSTSTVNGGSTTATTTTQQQRLTTWHDSTDSDTLHVATTSSNTLVTTTTAFEQILAKSGWTVRQQVKLEGQVFEGGVKVGQLTQGSSHRGVVIEADDATVTELIATTGMSIADVGDGERIGDPTAATYFELVGK